MMHSVRTFWVASLMLLAAANLHAQGRLLQPADLFQMERMGVIAWSPNRSAAAIEIHRPSRRLERDIPAGIAVLDVESGTLRRISPSLPDVVGFFRPAWSPDNRRLLFLSVDSNADVRAWVWTVGSGPPTLLTDLKLHDGLADRPTRMWRDAEHVVFMVRDPARSNEGPLYFGQRLVA